MAMMRQSLSRLTHSAERAVDRGLLGGLPSAPAPAGLAAPTATAFHPLGASASLTHDIVARLASQSTELSAGLEEAGDLHAGRNRDDEVVVDRHDHAGNAGNRAAGLQAPARRFLDRVRTGVMKYCPPPGPSAIALVFRAGT